MNINPVPFLKAVIEYDGTNYYGWQVQPGRLTVEGELRRAFRKLFGEEIEIRYASRTDRGVHAKGQVITFKSPLKIPVYKIQKSLNGCLRKDIIINRLTRCDEDFDPRYDVKFKLYVYSILNRQLNDYRQKNFIWHVPQKLNWNEIKKGTKLIKGRHDFSLFSSCDDKDKNTVIDMLGCSVKKTGDLYEISFRAKYFLTYMLRFLVGYLVSVGKGKETLKDLKLMLNGSGQRCNYCAPACGLELKKIVFCCDV